MIANDFVLKLRAQCLSEAIDKFSSLEDIMTAADRFYNFVLKDSSADAEKSIALPTALEVKSDDGTTIQQALKEATADIEQDTEQPARKAGNVTRVMASVLTTIIELSKSGNPVTSIQLKSKMEIPKGSLPYALEKLTENRYIRRQNVNKNYFILIPLKGVDGLPLVKTTEIVEDGKIIKKCPPGYAWGYGLGRKDSPVIQVK